MARRSNATRCEIAIRRPVSARIGAGCGVAFVAAIVGLAFANLWFGVGVLASIVTLLIIGLGFYFGFSEGPRVAWRGLARGFAGSRHIAFDEDDGGAPLVIVGFRCGGREFLDLQVPLARVESIAWSSGQATQLAQRDMNDWRIIVWYDADTPRRRPAGFRKPDQDLTCFGAADGLRATAEELGRRVAAVAIELGANLEEDAEGTAFVRLDSPPATEPIAPRAPIG